jgi:hypothetical protein
MTNEAITLPEPYGSTLAFLSDLEERVLLELDRRNVDGAANEQVRNILLDLGKQIESYRLAIVDAGQS